jgi:hypothetical protein
MKIRSPDFVPLAYNSFRRPQSRLGGAKNTTWSARYTNSGSYSKSLDPLWPQFVHDIPLQQLLASSHGSVEVFIPIVQGGEAVVNPSMVSGAYDFANRPFSYLTSSPQPGRLGFESILLAAVSRLFCSSCSAQLSHHPRPTKATASRHPNGHIFGRITSSTPFKVHFSNFWPRLHPFTSKLPAIFSLSCRSVKNIRENGGVHTFLNTFPLDFISTEFLVAPLVSRWW